MARSNVRTRRSNRKPLSELLRDAHVRSQRRAKEANRKRQSRDKRNCKFAAISETAPQELDSLPGFQRLIRWAIAALLFPFCIITTITLFQRVSDPAFFGPFWRSSEFWYFATGFVLICGWFFTKIAHDTFLYLYVLGHELTHVLFVYASLGKVADMKVTKQGGYIITNKSNVLIALSPYFVPFWTSIVILLSFAISYFTPIPHHEKILFFLIGGTWGFHMLWTIWMIPRDQPDLKENDTLFSLVVIYLANVIVVGGLICLATDRVTWASFAQTWLENTLSLYQHSKSFIVGLR